MAALDGAKVTKSANQSITTATDTDVTFNTEAFDDGNLHDNSTNNERITLDEAGVYLVDHYVGWDPSTDNSGWTAEVRKNNGGTTFVDKSIAANSGAQYRDNFGLMPELLAAGDYLTVKVRQASGSGKNVLASTSSWLTHLAAVKMADPPAEPSSFVPQIIMM